MTRSEAMQAIEEGRKLLAYYRQNPRARTLMNQCNWCGGKGCIWCGNVRING